MKKNSELSKALGEAKLIRESALKNAQDILLQAIDPKLNKMFNKKVNEQVGVVNQDPMDGPDDATFLQTAAEADLENPENALHQNGDGPQLLEQEDEDGDNLEEQEDGDDDLMDEQEDDYTIDLDEQEEDDDMTIELDEQGDEDGEEIEEQSDEDSEDIDEQSADDDEEITIEVVEDDIDEQSDEDSEDIDEDASVVPAAAVTAANESKKNVRALNDKLAKYRKAYAKVVKENKELKVGVSKLAKQVSEIRLFNAKVAAVNSILDKNTVNENIKAAAVKNVDKCKTLSEIKIAYNSFIGTAKASGAQRSKVSESRNFNAIKPNVNMNPKKTISEGQNKMLRLAGIID